MISLITPMAGKNHDVHGRVRNRTRKVLKEDGIATQSRMKKKAEMKHTLEANKSRVMAMTGVPRTITRLVA